MSLCSGLPLPSGLGSQAASHPRITDRDTKQFISCLREPAKNRPTGCNNFSGWRLIKLQTTSPKQLISLAGMGPGTCSVQVNCYWGTFKKIKESFPKTGRYLQNPRVQSLRSKPLRVVPSSVQKLKAKVKCSRD